MTAIQSTPEVRTADIASARLSTLTGLRFVAAFLVFLCHVQYLFIFSNTTVQTKFGEITEPGGHLAVAFFFVLSGFVLTWSAKSGDRARAFWRRRFFRIAPNHVVIFAATLALMIAAGAVVKTPVVIANLFLVHDWIPKLDYSLYAVNAVSWTLSVELAFYLLFPVLFVLARRIRPDRLWHWAIGVGVLVTLLPAIAQPLLPAEPKFLDMSWPVLWFLDGGPGRILEFALGILLARIVQTGRWVRVPVPAAVALVVAGYVAAMYAPMAWTLAALYAVPIGVLIASVAVSDINGRTGFLGGRVMVKLGDLSYAFYLLHMTLLFALHGALSHRLIFAGVLYEGHSWGVPGAVTFIVVSLAISLALSWLVYTLVERPAYRRWAKSRRRAGSYETSGALR